MAGFGVSLGDIALVGTYAYNVYKSCQIAGEAFASIISDGKSLYKPWARPSKKSHSQIYEITPLHVERRIEKPQSSLHRLSPTQQGEVEARLGECKSDLREVKKVLHQYKYLDTNDARYRD